MSRCQFHPQAQLLRDPCRLRTPPLVLQRTSNAIRPFHLRSQFQSSRSTLIPLDSLDTWTLQKSRARKGYLKFQFRKSSFLPCGQVPGPTFLCICETLSLVDAECGGTRRPMAAVVDSGETVGPAANKPNRIHRKHCQTAKERARRAYASTRNQGQGTDSASSSVVCPVRKPLQAKQASESYRERS